MWLKGVIPLWKQLMRMIIDRCSRGWRQTYLGRIRTVVQACRTHKALRRAGRADKLHHRFVTYQWLSGPVGTDQIKHSMLNRVPLRCIGREMGHGNADLEGVGQLLQPGLPAPATVSIRATAIGLYQQLLGRSVAPPALHQPPAAKGRDGKLRGLMRAADHHIAPVVSEVINAIGYGFAERLAGEIVIPHLQCITPPSAPRIVEPSNQLLLLGIHANNGVSGLGKSPPLLGNIAKLAIPIGLVGGGDGFAVALERVVAFSQEPRNGTSSDAEALRA